MTFQLKLFADGFRDIVLSPLAILATLYGLLFSSSEPDYYFKKLLRFGRKSDRFINLFDQHSETTADADDALTTTSDELLAPYQNELEKKLDDKFNKTSSDR